MDGWIDGWMDGWMDGRTDGRMDGWTNDIHTYIHTCVCEYQTDRWIHDRSIDSVMFHFENPEPSRSYNNAPRLFQRSRHVFVHTRLLSKWRAPVIWILHAGHLRIKRKAARPLQPKLQGKAFATDARIVKSTSGSKSSEPWLRPFTCTNVVWLGSGLTLYYTIP